MRELPKDVACGGLRGAVHCPILKLFCAGSVHWRYELAWERPGT